MIESLIGLSITSIWIVLGGTALLFLLRLVAALKAKLDVKAMILVLLLPFSVGFHRAFPGSSLFKTMYRIVVGVTFFFSLLALFWVFYTHFA